jgi:hypothetical protein
MLHTDIPTDSVRDTVSPRQTTTVLSSDSTFSSPTKRPLSLRSLGKSSVSSVTSMQESYRSGKKSENENTSISSRHGKPTLSKRLSLPHSKNKDVGMEPRSKLLRTSDRSSAKTKSRPARSILEEIIFAATEQRGQSTPLEESEAPPRGSRGLRTSEASGNDQKRSRGSSRLSTHATNSLSAGREGQHGPHQSDYQHRRGLQSTISRFDPRPATAKSLFARTPVSESPRPSSPLYASSRAASDSEPSNGVNAAKTTRKGHAPSISKDKEVSYRQRIRDLELKMHKVNLDHKAREEFLELELEKVMNEAREAERLARDAQQSTLNSAADQLKSLRDICDNFSFKEKMNGNLNLALKFTTEKMNLSTQRIRELTIRLQESQQFLGVTHS